MRLFAAARESHVSFNQLHTLCGSRIKQQIVYPTCDIGFGGRIDLLAIAPDGSLVLIELKRERTPRDVVAQALDYASWVGKLRADEITMIYERFAPTRSLEADFQQRFGLKLDEDMLNQNHQIVIVASTLDESSERIVNYLSERNISINILCFQIFALRANNS